MSSNHESDFFAFVDSSTHFEDLEKIIQKNHPKIITFDYETHKKLKKKNIPHEISDKYLNQLEIDQIQTKCYSFARWANSSKINHFFQYDEFNLGNFFYIEVFIFLIPFLKKFVEVKNIVENHNHAVFMSSGLLKETVELMGKSCSVITEQEFNSEVFLYDHLKFQNNLFKIKISKKNYQKFKSFFEKFVNNFLFSKNNFVNGVLMVEFNTNQYGSLFQKLNQNNLKPIFYGRKRPAIWDTSSFSIIKNSNTSIFTENELIDNSLKNIISNDREKIIPQILNVLENDDFFQNFFSIYKISFWKIIKPFIINLTKRRVFDAIKEINLAKTLLEKTKPKCILVLSESSNTDQFVISQAKKNKIPIMLLQHGLGGSDGPESNIINEFTGSMPILSNEFLVWGNAEERYAKQFGIEEKKIHILGSPAHDKIFTQPKNTQNLKKDFILVSTGSATTNHINDYSITANEEYEHVLKEICKTVSKTKKKLVIKIHPYVDGTLEREIANEVDPSIQVIKKGNMTSLIESCELMITLAITSATLNAQVLEKPVIRLPLKEWWGPPDTYRASPGLTVKIDEFESIFNKILNEPDFQQQIIDSGKDFVNDCLSNQGSSAQSVADFLKKY